MKKKKANLFWKHNTLERESENVISYFGNQFLLRRVAKVAKAPTKIGIKTKISGLKSIFVPKCSRSYRIN